MAPFSQRKNASEWASKTEKDSFPNKIKMKDIKAKKQGKIQKYEQKVNS